MTTGSALPSFPQSVPRGGLISWIHWFASATACQLACPPVRIGPDHPALGDFYFQAFNGSVSLSVAGYNYNSGWISFCWRDLHPLEWQLASLHGQKAKYSRRAHVFRVAPHSGHWVGHVARCSVAMCKGRTLLAQDSKLSDSSSCHRRAASRQNRKDQIQGDHDQQD